MSSDHIRILLIEDDEDDYIIARDLLSSSGRKNWHLDWVSDYESALATLEKRSHSIALVDYRLGAHSGLELLAAATQAGFDVPMILLTGLGAEEIDKAAMAAGAADYLVKGQITPALLERSIRHALQRKAAERELRSSKEQYQLLFDQNPHAMFVVEAATSAFLGVNTAAENLYGYSTEEFRQLSLAELASDRAHETPLSDVRPNAPLSSRHRRKDGSFIDVELTGNPLSFGGVQAVLLLVHDVTSRLILEAHVRQAQKMESMGSLAGGVAHDFNNLLAIISGHAWRAKENIRTPEALSSSLAAIEQAVSRGAGLVRQILTFARKTSVEAEPLQIEQLVPEFLRMISETFPKEIVLKRTLAPGLPVLVADSNQVNQALLNLCVNARDAMNGAGDLTISAVLVEGDQLPTPLRKTNGQSTRYIRLSVQDTGAGMDEATRRRIFEPFFTTKGSKGTGLGLAVVYGIAKAHSGYVDVESEPGKGSCFHLYFPVLAQQSPSPKPESHSVTEDSLGSETILLVEDEELLRELMQTLLETKGYKVLTACDGHEGLEVFARNREAISLLLADMGLPKLGGWEMFQRMRQTAPNLKAIFASGYLEPELRTRILNSGVCGFVQKPCQPNELYSRIREALARP
ncbi:MAG TPA: response regulator [Methylomirabilota bacterium]|nr:response regulator [Methylomirabilota bacterium]